MKTLLEIWHAVPAHWRAWYAGWAAAIAAGLFALWRQDLWSDDWLLPKDTAIPVAIAYVIFAAAVMIDADLQSKKQHKNDVE